MLARQSVEAIIEKDSSPLSDQLRLSKHLRKFAVDELSLPETKSYNTYVDLKREYPVWVVVAASEFSLDPKQWCYLVIGCANYRGYFKHAEALKYAENLQLKGYDTAVSGAAAYSTLGWFSDPLLPSMMRHGNTHFAEILFHEMAHQRLYINGDSDFNEAFASLVAEVGVIKWLSREENTASENELNEYKNSLRVQDEFYQLLNETKDSLDALYISDQTEYAKRVGKQSIFNKLKSDHALLVSGSWNGRAWYISWFEPELNNAKFVSISTYRQRVDELRQFLTLCNNDLKRFYGALSQLKAKKHRVIIPNICPDSEL